MTEHDHTPEKFDQAFWDDRYRSKQALWSGNPNPHLVTETAGLTPGAVLDVGAGEGADAIWLASQGWHVTAVDISAVALERAAAHAESAGPEVAGRISWRRQDVIGWEPDRDHFDLVSAQYMQLPPALRQPLFVQLAEAVAPGGSLLIVGHHLSDMDTNIHRPHSPELFFTGEELVDTMPLDGWEIVTNAIESRTITDPDGNPATLHDTVFRARRSS